MMSIAMKKAMMIAPAASAIIGIFADGSHGQFSPALPNPGQANPALPNPLPANPALPNPLPAIPAEPNPLPRSQVPAPGAPAFPNQRYFYPRPFSAPYGTRYWYYYCPYYARYYPFASVCPGGWRAVPAP
jgi:hypothetical protein